jgi:hypothetical protein
MQATLRITTLFLVCVAAGAVAEPEVPEDTLAGGRTELWLAVPSWPGLSELEPAAGGAFDDYGLGIGGAIHWPVQRFGGGRMMVGIEGAVQAVESNVPVYLDDLLARDGYLAVTAKWMLGKSRALSLDAGLGIHLLDITQLESDFYRYLEFESWEEKALGALLGVTWDVGAGRPDKQGGLSLGLRVHFVDFGIVRDEDIFIAPVLGTNAGELAGPIYALQIGYRWR